MKDNFDMKRIKYTILLFLAILTIKVYGDIIIITYTPVKVCVRIENLKDYPEIEIIGLSNCLAVFSKPKADIIDSHSCMEVHKACPLTFYAVKKDYLEKMGIENIKWKKDKNVRKSKITVNAKETRVYYQDVEILEINYFVVGFNKKSMVVIKTSETNKFNNGKPDIVDGGFFNPMDYPKLLYPELLRLRLQKSF